MPTKRSLRIRWLPEPEAADYPAAESYLSLIYRPGKAARLVEELQSAEGVEFRAKDIFRASQLPLLGVSNFHVKKDRKRIIDGNALSPILLVRDRNSGRVIIADGYHRVCAVCSFDEDASIPCRIV